MNDFARDLEKVKGLKLIHIQSKGYQDVTTFPASTLKNMQGAIELMEEYFFSARSIGHSYNEIIFSIGYQQNLIAYQLDESTLAFLLAEEKINLPVLHMTLKNVHNKIKNRQYEEPAEEPVRVAAPKLQQTPRVPTEKTSKTPLTPQAEAPPEPKPEPEPPKERPYMMYRGQKVYKDAPPESTSATEKPKYKKRFYRGQEI